MNAENMWGLWNVSFRKDNAMVGDLNVHLVLTSKHVFQSERRWSRVCGALFTLVCPWSSSEGRRASSSTIALDDALPAASSSSVSDSELGVYLVWNGWWPLINTSFFFTAGDGAARGRSLTDMRYIKKTCISRWKWWVCGGLAGAADVQHVNTCVLTMKLRSSRLA